MPIPTTPRYDKALMRAEEHATAMNAPCVTTEHLLLALMESGAGYAFEILSDAGLTLERVRTKIQERGEATPNA